jgi:hypothetical protein
VIYLVIRKRNKQKNKGKQMKTFNTYYNKARKENDNNFNIFSVFIDSINSDTKIFKDSNDVAQYKMNYNYNIQRDVESNNKSLRQLCLEVYTTLDMQFN